MQAYVQGVEAFALYLFQEKKLLIMNPTDNIQIKLEPFNFELITVASITQFGPKGIQFAPIGLANMLNTGGAIQSIRLDDETNSLTVGLKGSGEMRLYASQKPTACRINGVDTPFIYEDQMVLTQVPWASPSGSSAIQYMF